MELPVKEIEEHIPAEQTVLPVTCTAGRGYLFVKRVLDVVLSLVAVVLLALPMIIIAVLIRLDSKGPAIFSQDRMGKDGKVFRIYKFRTMKVTAPTNMATRDIADIEKHITKLGGFLRRTSIDELPQLYNIIRGDMSIVGYRPVCLTEDKLNDLRNQYGVFALRPGITGLAQVHGRDNVNYQEKARMDAEYVSGCGLKLDTWCLLRTFKVILTGEGVI